MIYDVYGKVTQVTTVSGTIKAKYFYDGGGQRVKKETYNSTTVKTTWYIAGHIYERTGTGGELLHTEITISGAGRLGVAYTNAANNSLDYNYELSDHLGNVRAVIRKTAPGSTNPIDILSYADYFPFGWQMPGRNQQGDYRYAYQGQEKDPETGWEAFELRMYDGRVGRWMTTDPYSQYHSPYLAMGNNPVKMIDPDGGFSYWKPDRNGNLIAEKGDNALTLADYLDIGVMDAAAMVMGEGHGLLSIEAGDKITLDNVFTRSIANHPTDYDTDAFLGLRKSKTGPLTSKDYNCWGAAINGTKGSEIMKGVGIDLASTFDNILVSDYTISNSNDAIFGQTVIRFANGFKIAEHGAVYYGTSNDGTIYVYTKNGWYFTPEIMTLNELMTKIPTYGRVKGLLNNSADTGFYTIKKPRNNYFEN
ncbi:MAG: RHS repeat-associated protein [Saprospiraceae bacterium]